MVILSPSAGTHVPAVQNTQSRSVPVPCVFPVPGSITPLSVKTSVPVPRELIHAIMRELGKVSVSLPVSSGDVILPDVLHTGADIVATRELYSL